LNEKLCGTRSSKAEQLHNEGPFKVQTGIGGAKKRLNKTDKSCLVQGNGKRGETKKFTVLWLVGRARCMNYYMQQLFRSKKLLRFWTYVQI
jgi:hypothetical protein